MTNRPLDIVLTAHPDVLAHARLAPGALTHISPTAARRILVSDAASTLDAADLAHLAITVLEHGDLEEIEALISRTPHLDVLEYCAYHHLGATQPVVDRALLTRGHLHPGLRDSVDRCAEMVRTNARTGSLAALEENIAALSGPWQVLRSTYLTSQTPSQSHDPDAQADLSACTAGHALLLCLGYEELLVEIPLLAAQADRDAVQITRHRDDRSRAEDRAQMLWQMVNFMLAQLRATHPKDADDLIVRTDRLPLVLELARPDLPKTWSRAFEAALAELRQGKDTTPLPAHHFVYFNHQRLSESEKSLLTSTIREHRDTVAGLTRARWLLELAATPAPDDDWASLDLDALHHRLTTATHSLPSAAAAALGRSDIDTDTALHIARRVDHHNPFLTARPWDSEFIARQVAGAIGWVRHLPGDTERSPLHPGNAACWDGPLDPQAQTRWLCGILDRALHLCGQPRDLRRTITTHLPAHLALAVARTRPWHELELWLREDIVGPLLAADIAQLYTDATHGDLLDRFVATGNARNLPIEDVLGVIPATHDPACVLTP